MTLRKVSTEAGHELATSLRIPYLETSAKDPPVNVDDAFAEIVRVVRYPQRKAASTSSSLGFTTKIEDVPPPAISFAMHAHKATGSLLGGTWDVAREYDPQWPNEYEKIIKERAEKKEIERAAAEKAKEVERERERREKIFAPTLTARPLVDDYSDDEEDDGKPAKPQGAAIAPPQSLIEETVDSTVKVSTIASHVGVSVVAAKIMTRMGYKEGQGLGKDEQGINRALEVEKTSARGGKIISTPTAEPAHVPTTSTSTRPESPTESITEIMKNPTKVVLLRNMVGPGEVDNDLEPEVKEECSKYGEVVSCVVFELKGPKVCAEEAVRIFVEFKRVESAIKAVVDLNGRFFGGRTVRAGFYEYERFKRLDLVDH
ncbi:Splicing factor 45 [Halotydeus destructor]|nr:Splicing factor 45 [Halotydeus destructor]